MSTQKAVFDDKKTWEMMNSGQTAGIFQIESVGLTDAIKRMKAKKLDSLIDVIALYRPGPLDAGTLDDYIERSIGKRSVTLDHPLLEPILRDTFGIILFQEQCLAIANKLAGYTLPEADLFRKAISSKKEEMLAKERDKFVKGCQNSNNIEHHIATKIFDNIVTFAGYAFNKSHSVCYAVISYWTAWLKANYTIEYMCKLLSSQKMEEDVRHYLREAKDLGISIDLPNINESESGFSISTTQENTILFGLSKIKGIGLGAANYIIENRPYSDFFDFMDRIDKKIITSDIVDRLIKAGCFRKVEKQFGTKQLLSNLDSIIGFYKNKRVGIPQLVARKHIQLWTRNQVKTEFDPLELSHLERETLGLYVTTHPIKNLPNPKVLTTEGYKPLKDIEQNTGKFYSIGVLTDKVRAKKSRRGSVFHEIQIEDEYAIYKFPVFGGQHEEVIKELHQGDIIAILFQQGKSRVYVKKIKKI